MFRIRKRLLKLLVRHMPGYVLRRSLLRPAGYDVGRDVFIGEDLIIKDELADRGMVRIGNRVSIADRVMLVVSSRANFSRFRMYMGESHLPIDIGDDAWLGAGCIVLPGVRIGKGAVVGAASLVTADVPDLTIVAGIPARPIRKLEIPGRS